MPRQRTTRQCRGSSSGSDSGCGSSSCLSDRDLSDSDSSGSASGPVTVFQGLYEDLQLSDALRRPADYAAAAAELAGVLQHLYARQCSKLVQALVVADAEVAIACCDGRVESRDALAAVMDAAERALPQAKRSALQRQYRQSSVQLTRRQRRGGGATGAAEEGSDEDDGLPATFSALPLDAVAHVFRYLDPITLARSACVCREWRAAAADDSLWQRHCARLLGSQAAAAPGSGSHRRRFADAAARHPARLLRWRTNRVVVGRRKLAWLQPAAELGVQRRESGRCRHVGPGASLVYLGSGGRSCGGGNDSSSSSSDGSGRDSGSEEDPGSMSRRLRFWQL